MRQFLYSAIAIGASALAACAGAKEGTRPDDMSVAGHGAAATHWRSVSKATTQDLAKYNRARALAAQHRAASQALVDAEARACNGVALDDRDISPFARSQDIESVSELSVQAEAFSSDNLVPPTLRGAVVKFRPVPGLTRSSLQRIIDCHLARNASLGYPAQVPCPLALKGVSAVVKDSGNGLAAELTSPDLGVAREIASRAERLGPRPVQKKVETPLPQT